MMFRQENAEILAQAVYESNREMNRAKREHDTLRERLFVYMKDAGKATFNFITGSGLKLDVYTETPTCEYIDVYALRAMVDEVTFMAIVSATKEAVMREAGEAVCIRATRSREGKERVCVKLAKE